MGNFVAETKREPSLFWKMNRGIGFNAVLVSVSESILVPGWYSVLQMEKFLIARGYFLRNNE